MADSRIHDLTALASLAVGDLFAADDASNLAAASGKVTAQQIIDLAAAELLLDEDTMTSNSATKVPSQQSVKAYVDTEVAGAGGSNDGTYSAIAHSASGAVALNFNDSDVGFKVTASANITDITFSNGPTSGNQKRRTVEVVATASITVASGTLDVVESGIPTSMVNGDKFMADLVVTA